MRQRFEKKTPNSHRFWEIETSGNQVLTRFGIVGAAGRVVVKDCPSEHVAEGVVRGKIEQKLADGYGTAPTSGSAPPLDGSLRSLARPFAEQVKGKSVAELETSLEQARSKNEMARLRAICEAILQHQSEHFGARYWRFRVLDYAVSTNAPLAEEDRHERDAERDWVWANADDQTQMRERYRVCLSRIWERLEAQDLEVLRETFTFIDQARELCEGQEKDLALLSELRSSLDAQIAFATFQTGETT